MSEFEELQRTQKETLDTIEKFLKEVTKKKENWFEKEAKKVISGLLIIAIVASFSAVVSFINMKESVKSLKVSLKNKVEISELNQHKKDNEKELKDLKEKLDFNFKAFNKKLHNKVNYQKFNYYN